MVEHTSYANLIAACRAGTGQGDTFGTRFCNNGHIEYQGGQAATQADVDALSVSQTAQDALIAANATKAELAAVQAQVTANVDKAVTTIARQPDNSLLITFDDTTTATVNAATAATETDPVYTADKPTLALKTELASETAARTAADSLLIPKSDIATAGEVDAGTDATKLPNVVELKRKLDALNITGDFIGSSATFAGLPTNSSGGKTAVNGDWATLTAVDGGNARGVYLYDGANYAFAFELGSDVLELTQAQIQSTTGADYTTPGQVTTERLDQWYLSRIVDQVVPQTTNFNWDTDGLSEGMVLVAKNVIDNSISFDKGSFDLTRNGVIVGTQTFTWFGGQTIVAQRRGTVIDLITFDDRGRLTFENEATFLGNALRHDETLLAKDTGRLWYNKTNTVQNFDNTDLVNFGYFDFTNEVVFPGDNGQQIINRHNKFYLDETVGAAPALQSGGEYSTGIIQANSTDDKATRDAAQVSFTHYSVNADGDGWQQAQAASGEIATETIQLQEIIGTWTGSVVVDQDAHTGVNTGIDFTNCDYLYVTFADRAASEGTYTWSKVVDYKQMISDGGVLVHRHDVQYIWLRSIGDPTLGNLQARAFDTGADKFIRRVVAKRNRGVNVVTSSVTYDSNEADTGKRTPSGDIIYRSTFDGFNVSNGNIVVNMGVTGIREIWGHSLCLRAANATIVPLPFNDGNINSRFWVGNDNVLYAGSNWAAAGATDMYGWIEYSKV